MRGENCVRLAGAGEGWKTEDEEVVAAAAEEEDEEEEEAADSVEEGGRAKRGEERGRLRGTEMVQSILQLAGPQ
jgi:hypothetical protein